MMKIKILKKIDELMHSGYIYINEFYLSRLNEENENQIIDFEPATEQKYYLAKSYYCDVDSTFDSICDLGKNIVTKYQINSIDDISMLYPTKKDDFKSLLKEWTCINPFPYKKIDKENFIISFFIDCVFLYTVFDINKWLFKINNLLNNQKLIDDEIRFKLNNSIKLIDLLSFMNSNSNYLRDQILNLPLEYNPVDDYEYLTNYINNKNYFKDIKLSEFKILNTIIQRNLMGYVFSNMINRKEEFFITDQQPFFEEIYNKYRTIKTAESIIGIAYDKLLLNLGESKLSYKKGICFNINCNNQFIIKKGNKRIYCNSKVCQNLRHRNNVRFSAENKKRSF